MTCHIQKTKPCKSCPWIRDGDRTLCFEPETLKKTIVDTLQEQKVQSCHSQEDYMCAGALAFAERTLEGGAHSLQLVQIGYRLGLIDLDKIDASINTFESIEEMLVDHGRRMGYEV